LRGQAAIIGGDCGCLREVLKHGRGTRVPD